MIPQIHKPPDFNNKFYTEQWGKFVKSWKYHNKKGEWIFCTACYDPGKEGFHKNKIYYYKKFIYKNGEWIIDPTTRNNLLYDYHNIIKSEKPIVIVNDELSIDILNKTNKDDFLFTTWPEEIPFIENTDFSILKNKKVYYFSSSYVISKTVIQFFKKNLNNIIVIDPIVERPGWNIPDDLEHLKLEKEFLRVWIIQNEKPLSELIKENNDKIKWPFKILGPSCGYLYFLHGETGQIFKIRQGGLNQNNMKYLASLEFWKDEFSYTTRKNVEVIDWNEAEDVLIRTCNRKPPFDHNSTRGRGIWCENGKLIIHTGKELVYETKKIKVADYSPNGHVYERIVEKKLYIKKIDINEFELLKIKNCIDKLSINTYLEKIYLTGWSVLSIFSGALDWRSHIWLTGTSGSGKTAIINMIILKILGAFALYAEGGSTGAGIFQELKRTNDSFPIIHDEIDKEDKGSIKSELEIIRSCSASQGKMYKGTADQTGKTYTFRCMFCLSSVNVLLHKKNDRSRFSVINVTRNEDIDWKTYRKEIIETFDDETCEKIRSRFFYNWDIVVKSIKNFKDAAGNFCGDQRTGDQVGTLLAGYCLLYDMKVFTFDECMKICEKYLKDFTDEGEFVSDELDLLNKIFTSKIIFSGVDYKREETTLLNLLKRAAGEGAEIADIRCQKELYKYGIKYYHEKNELCIAYSYEWIKIILKDTPWFYNYGDILKRLSFTKKNTRVCRFGNYYHGRSIVLDAGCVLRLSDDKVYMEAGF